MSVPATFKYDLSNGAITPVQEGRTAVTYPFLPNGSIGPKVYTRKLLQQEAYYVPATMGLERDSVWAGGDPQAYLISESSPEHVGIGDMLRFTRSYARIPAAQTVYGSRAIQRPIMHDIFSGSSYAVSFDNGATSHVFTSRTAVTIAAGAGWAAPIYKVTHTAHGKAAGELTAVWIGNRLVAAGAIFDVVDANNYHITFFEIGFSAAGFAGFAVAANARYVNGVTSGPCSSKETTTYYLPGVSVGITTLSDVPVITTVIDPVSWLGEIVAYIAAGSLSTYFSIVESGPLERWLAGPIYSQTSISIQMKDALETVSVSA